MCKIENVKFKDGEWVVLEVHCTNMTTFERYKYCLESDYYHRNSYIVTFEKDHIFLKSIRWWRYSQKIYFDDEFVFWSAIKNV